MKQHGTLYIISAPSGAGKTTLVDAVLEKVGPHRSISRAITYTTREPRITERDGYDFHFVTTDIFRKLIKQDFFIEWSNAHVAYYGTPRSVVEDLTSGASSILVIDRVGAEQVKRFYPHAVMIWIQVPTIEILRERLYKRATETDVQIERRIQRAVEEIQRECETPLYEHHIENSLFDNALERLIAIIDRHENAQKEGQHNELTISAY